VIVNFLYLFVFSLSAQEFDFYEGEIDFFRKKQAVKEVINEEINRKNKLEVTVSKKKNTDWSELLNTKSDEMYREGNHLPPRAMLKAVKNPTRANLRNYKLWQERKMKQLSTFQARLMEVSGDQSFERETKSNKDNYDSFYVKKEINESLKLKIFYSTSCPNCQRMHSEIYKLMKAGIDVELVSVDQEKIPLKGVKIRMRLYKNELEKYTVKGTPHMVLSNRKTKRYYNIIGYQNFNNIMKVAMQAIN